MNQNIANKRRVFQRQIRVKQIESLFTKIRNQLTESLNSQIRISALNQMLDSLPKSLPEIFLYLKQNQHESSFILDYLFKKIDFWIRQIEKQALKIDQWASAMQILIKMLTNSTNLFQRQLILNQSQQKVIKIGMEIILENKVLKNQAYFLMLDYYLQGLCRIKSILKSKNFIKPLIQSLCRVNWRKRGKQLIKVVFLCNKILDFAIDEEEKQIVSQLFLQSSTFMSLATILQQITAEDQQEQQQSLVSLILVYLINISFFLNEQKLYKQIKASQLHEYLIQKIAYIEEKQHRKQLCLQLCCNLLLNYEQFKEFFKKNVNLVSVEIQSEVSYSLIEEIRQICDQSFQ